MTNMVSHTLRGLAALLLIFCAVFPLSGQTLARTAFSTPTITVSLTFSGPFRHKTTIHSKENFRNVAAGACFVNEGKVAAVTTFQAIAHRGPNLSAGDSFEVGIVGYRSSVARYGGISRPTPSHPYPSGAALSVTIGAATGNSHTYATNLEGQSPGTITVRIWNGGRSGTFQASHIARAQGETIAGRWACSQVKVIRPRA